MNRKRMISIGKNHKTQVTIATLASILIVNAVLIGNGQIALARHHDTDNNGINVQTDTNQGQACDSGTSSISGSCTASSTDSISQGGGVAQVTPVPSPSPSQCATMITLSLSPISVSLGTVEATGTLTACTGSGVPDATITLTGTGISGTLSVVTDASGTFTVNIPAPSSVGTYTVQAHFAGQGILEPSNSATKTFFVNSCPTDVIFALTPRSVAPFDPVLASGNLLSGCPGNNGNVGGATITFTTPGSPSSGMTVTDINGAFAFVFTAPSLPGTYTVQVHFAGQGLFEPSSESLTFTVS